MNPIRQVHVTGWAACAGLTLAFLVGGLGPTVTREMSSETRAAEFAKHHTTVNELRQVRADLESMLESMKLRRDDQPVTLEPLARTNQRIVMLQELATEHALEVDEITTAATRVQDAFQLVPIHLQGSGSFPDAASFLSSVHENHPDLRVTGFDLSGNIVGRETRTSFVVDLEWCAALGRPD